MTDLISKEGRKKGFSVLMKRLDVNYHEELLKMYLYWWKEKISSDMNGLISPYLNKQGLRH